MFSPQCNMLISFFKSTNLHSGLFLFAFLTICLFLKKNWKAWATCNRKTNRRKHLLGHNAYGEVLSLFIDSNMPCRELMADKINSSRDQRLPYKPFVSKKEKNAWQFYPESFRIESKCVVSASLWTEQNQWVTELRLRLPHYEMLS